MIIYLYFHNITNFLDYIFMLFNFITQACDIISQNMGLVIDDHFSSIDILTVTFIMVRAIPPCPTWALIDCSINSHILFLFYILFFFLSDILSVDLIFLGCQPWFAFCPSVFPIVTALFRDVCVASFGLNGFYIMELPRIKE
jgi:hypothetical protein